MRQEFLRIFLTFDILVSLILILMDIIGVYLKNALAYAE